MMLEVEEEEEDEEVRLEPQMGISLSSQWLLEPVDAALMTRFLCC